MSEYIISACSTADLTKEQFEKYDIKYIYFHYSLDGVQYPDDLGQTMCFDEFYKKMEEGAETATSHFLKKVRILFTAHYPLEFQECTTLLLLREMS